MLQTVRMHLSAATRRRALAATATAAMALSISCAGSASAADLPVWDDYSYEGQVAVIETLVKNFEAAHPDVDVQRTQRTFDDLALTLKLAVSAGDGPVVTKVNQGAKDMGAMAKEGLLLPLDPYIQKYGWTERQSDSILARDRWTKDGKFGTGETYGISSLGEIVGLYYNEKVLKDAGVSLPLKTFEDFLEACDKVKAAGATPIAMGTAKQHLALHLLAGISQAHIDASKRSELDDLIYGRGGSWQTPGNVESAALLQKWAEEGYYFDGFQGISGDDAVQLFIAGQAAFLTSGTWYFGDMKANPDIHFMAIPAPKGVEHPLSVGGVDPAWAITALAKDQATKDLAGSYIDYMVSPEAAVEWAKAGYLPSTKLPDDANIDMTPLLKEGVAIWKSLNANDAIGHYPDWSSPTMLKTIDDNMPLLLSGRDTPEAFIGKLQADYAAYLASK
ncbi:extracellular solute-binding protein [Consotaella salsifontis]|uniref:Carbohydrate ABC transporter substrate-binding protein, CUT1 family n=1 Tax=Consotaella salsifontis TaxID=1365950 RepID=A0A1T4RAG5_9HYPH|nr:extracellular solute-binding protein [Consotaella salsifontis]SKA12786.1 carbohydrate ABC transporter substrate-binding protein, CUT1 family [Consotaella salsifontis]